MMGPDAVLDLMRGAPSRFETVRMEVLDRMDWEAYTRGLVRFRGNPHIARILKQTGATKHPSAVRSSVWRILYRRPAFHREEVYEGPDMRLTYVTGGDGRTHWGFDPDSRKVEQDQDRSIARLTPMGEEAVYGPDAFEGLHPSVGHWFDPHVGELLEPATLAYVDGLVVEGLEMTNYLGP